MRILNYTVAAAVILLSLEARASEFNAGSLVIETPWSRATPAGVKVAAGYARIQNKGSTSDRLLGGTLTISSHSEVHETVDVNGVARMQPLNQGLEVKPGEAVELKPSGYHLMFTDLQRPLKPGETLTGALQFEKAGSVAVEFVVGPIGAQSNPAQHHHH